ncbi:C-C motif chemokine 14-like [Orycteropus afer afer]|uniref:C-C motif chemokine n=1 Tax=Orycteropus afer afer TaxID=1230840 RepID=A0A8B7ADP1_ORYAF|nr:C-C motif chemokine 14-like [Orycteropus afer afer]
MKVLLVAVSLIIAFALRAEGESSSRGPYHPAECCFSYTNHAIPHLRITDYYETSSQCPKPGVVFITKKGHSICANPSDDWVQDSIRDLEEN